jgi:hypothetical protein
MKNIVRWTVGNVSEEGLECLERSAINFINFYKDQFDYFICFNNIDAKKLNWSKKLNIRLIDQKDHLDSLDIMPLDGNPCWKIYPPRLDINKYEIFIDNDLVLYKKIDLEKIIENNNFFITQALEKNYGSFNKIIKSEPNLNTGFFGIAKKFDFKKEINKLIKKFNVNWNQGHFEEQGIVSYIIKKQKYGIIDLNKLYVCFGDYQLAKNGFHFAGLNVANKKRWHLHNTKFM